MWIGEVNIILKNLSKSQREYYKQLKALYETEFSGTQVTGYDFLRNYYEPGKATKEKIEKIKEEIVEFESTPDYTEDISEDTDEDADIIEGYDEHKEFVDGLIEQLNSVNFGPKGNYLAQELADTLEYLVNHYNYEAVYNVWNALPPEIQEGIFDGDVKARYKVLEGAASYIEGLTEAYYQPNFDEAWTE